MVGCGCMALIAYGAQDIYETTLITTQNNNHMDSLPPQWFPTLSRNTDFEQKKQRKR